MARGIRSESRRSDLRLGCTLFGQMVDIKVYRRETLREQAFPYAYLIDKFNKEFFSMTTKF